MSSTISHWAVRSRAEVPPGSAWLSPAELQAFSRLRLPKRRADWRVGRWAAKHAVAECMRQLGVLPALVDISVLAALDGAPEASVAGTGLRLSVSISHSASLGFAVACTSETPVGCDIERVEPRSARFVRDYFTAAEAALVEGAAVGARPLLATLVWSAKESALKLRRLGLRADTRSVRVELPPDAAGSRGGALLVRCASPDETLAGAWWLTDGFVHTIVGEVAPVAPGIGEIPGMDPDVPAPQAAASNDVTRGSESVKVEPAPG